VQQKPLFPHESHLYDDDALISAEAAFSALADVAGDSGGTVVRSADSPFAIEADLTVTFHGRDIGVVPAGMEPGAQLALDEVIELGDPEHGYLGFHRGCRCTDCRRVYCTVVGVVTLRVGGLRPSEIAAIISLAPNQARGMTQRYAPWRPWREEEPDRLLSAADLRLFADGKTSAHETDWMPPTGLITSDDSSFSITTDGAVLLADEVVGRIPVGMEPGGQPPSAVRDTRRSATGHGYAGFVRGCNCARCRTGYCNAVGTVSLRIEGWTLEDIGAAISRTRERARQLSQKHAPWRPWEAIQTEHRAECDFVDQVERTASCPTCGREFVANRVKRFCEAACREMNSVLRYHVDDARRRAQRTNMAAWVMRNPDKVSPEHYRTALNILEYGPDHGSGKRWLVEGTETWRVAVEACERGYPIFGALPDAIRRQVQQYLGLPVDDLREEDDAGGAITAEEALEALDAFFTDAELE
jgi:hypothetical protein